MFAALVMLFPAIGMAAEQRLSDLAYAGRSVDAGVVTVRSTGAATLRITFVAPDVARVQVMPTGTAVHSTSPAVEGTPAVLADTRVSDSGDDLLIQNAGLSLRINKQHLRVDAYDAANQQPISLESPGDGTTWDTDTGQISSSRILGDAEHIYGLGQDNANHGMLDRRGSEREMWTGQQIRSGNVTASYPVPFYLSTGAGGRGYGCFVDNVWHMNFDLGKSQRDRLSWTSPGGPIDYYLINGPSFKTIVGQYTKLTGRPSMLPLWALGFWQSRCFFQSFDDIDHSVTRIQKDGLPIDVAVVDSAWSKADMDFKWSDKFIAGRSSAKDWIDEFHRRGLHVILSTKGPMDRPDADNYAHAASLGLFATDGHGQPITAGYFSGHLLDVTSPNMPAWLATQLSPLTADGVDGWWLDLNEPEGEPPQAVYHTGTSVDIHNTFSTINNREYFDYSRDVAHEARPVILGRAATAGTQRYSGIVWTGDINSDWPTFRAHLPEMQNAGLSGLPYWTNDSGGFISGFLNDDRYGDHAELYQRWFEFTCFAPIARAHKAGPSEPYEYGPAVEATAKKYLQLRYRMMPYIYTLAHETTVDGLPMVRPLVLDYQDDPGSAEAKTEYLFGDDLLVAPIIWAKATARPVYFPPGSWVSLEDGYQVEGGKTVVIAAASDRLPLFVRAGAILPQAPDMADTLQKPWDPITLEAWPHGSSTASVYEDDDQSAGYAQGDCTTTTIQCAEQPGQSVVLHVTPDNDKFGPRQWIAKLHLTSTPKAVSLDGQPLPTNSWTWDAPSATLTASFTGGRVARALEVTLDGSSLPRPAAPAVHLPAFGEDGEPAGTPKQIAQFLPPPILPIRIEAANFDKGGEKLAFHIRVKAAHPVYRTDGPPIINSTDAGGGYAIDELKAREWLAYTIDAGPSGGWYAVSARVRPSAEAELSLLRDRTTPLTMIEIPAPPTTTTPTAGPTGPAWTDAPGTAPFYLPPGVQILTVRVVKPGFQLANLTFTRSHP